MTKTEQCYIIALIKQNLQHAIHGGFGLLIKNYFKNKINKINKNYITKLEKEIDNYFKLCDAENEKNQTKLIKCYTLSGLCRYLGISRGDINVLAKNIKSEHIISNAKLIIENFIEENLLNGKISASSAVIVLKYNFNWTDKVQKDIDSGDIFVDFGISSEYSE